MESLRTNNTVAPSNAAFINDQRQIRRGGFTAKCAKKGMPWEW